MFTLLSLRRHQNQSCWCFNINVAVVIVTVLVVAVVAGVVANVGAAVVYVINIFVE